MKLLLNGFDSVYCAYFLQPTGRKPLDFQLLAEQQDSIRKSKHKNSIVITLGDSDFLLKPYSRRQELIST